MGAFPLDVSPIGALDMAGNVSEWLYAGSDQARVVRGGSWFNDANALRLDYRVEVDPALSMDDVGFRCVQDDSTRLESERRRPEQLKRSE